jgi:phospholipid N-methyltransferase
MFFADSVKTPKARQVRAPAWPLFESFLSDPRVASFCGSSSCAARAILDKIDFSAARKIVEFGPGSGALTRPLLTRLEPEGRVLALEVNQDLVSYLEDSLSDPRLQLLHESAESVKRVCDSSSMRPDVILCGIPFSFLPEATTRSILRQSASVLSASGKLVLYQAWAPPFLPSRVLKSELTRHFQVVSTENVLRNFPPLQIMTCSGARAEALIQPRSA